ncbi:MAG: tetratricopeptide repeat protein [Rhodocyclales bacterium]|nr:tetratricopeptide repeat protein [Rhodocyclales bacterium]
METNTSDFLNAIERAKVLREQGNMDEALRAYQAAADDFPHAPRAHYELGTMHGRLGQAKLAEACYLKALALAPRHPEANNKLGLIYMQRGEFDSAEFRYRTALAEQPDFLDAHLNLGRLLHDVNRLLEAEYLARRAIGISPESSDAYVRLGQALRSHGRITESIGHFRRAAELDPKSAAPRIELGFCSWNLGRHRDAERELKAAVELAPDSFPAWANCLLVSNYTVRDRAEVFALYAAFGAMIRNKCGPLPALGHSERPDPDRRLRIGFMSGDFRRHSVAYFLEGALGHFNRNEFRLFAYYNFRTEDEVTQELKPLFHAWRGIYGMPDQDVTDLIAADRIDILIDLSGVMAGARPLVLGRKPAPVQINWIGYPNTTGLDCIDYRLTDAWADPEGETGEFFSETLWRLPRPFLCYTPPASAPEVQPPPCLDQAVVTFGSFNSRAKLSEECIALWVSVLEAVPNSRLVLKSVYGTDDEPARDSLRRVFVDRGFDPDRIEILLRRGPVEGHLAAYHEIDIALDTFPYHGTTTTCEALWMGVPVVTLAGDRHASRVGASLLTSIGLEAFVAEDVDEYVEIAVALAENPQSLLGLRQTMRDRMRSSPLMDRNGMGADLGAALRGMWRRHCEKFPPEAPIEAGSAGEADGLLKLHVGGTIARDGWKILDAEPRPGVDFLGSIQDLSSFADESCSDVYCAHMLARVGQTEILDVLNGFHRILAPGGRLYLSVPDLDKLVWLFSNPDAGKAEKFHVMRMMFGGQLDEHDFHRIGLNLDFLTDYLGDVGFSSIEHVESLGMFEDTSETRMFGHPVSLNLIVTK